MSAAPAPKTRFERWAILFPVVPIVLVAAFIVAGCIRPLAVKGGQPMDASGAFGGRPVAAATAPAGSAQPPTGWSVMRTSKSGAPLIATQLLHPDSRDKQAFAAAAWLSPTGLRFTLVPGTIQPGGSWATNAEVPADQRSSLAAVFNSGFKYKDLDGGFRAEGTTAVPLKQGEASLAITKDGTATVGAWGTDITDSPDLVAVRQNLHLIVDGGTAVDGLLTRHDGSWSTEHHQVQHTLRSGLGQLADGSLVYVAGPDMDLQQLADALVSVHAVKGMQLDIHPNMIVFHLFGPGSGTAPGKAQQLLELMTAPLNRYLVPDRRDFITATER